MYIDENASAPDEADVQSGGKAEKGNIQRTGLIHSFRDEIGGEPVPHAHFAGNIEKQKCGQQPELRTRQNLSRLRHFEATLARGSGHLGDEMNNQGNGGEHGSQVTELHGVATQQIGGDKRSGETSESEEQIQEIERRRAARFTY